MVSNYPELSLVLSPPAVSRSDPDYLNRFQILEEIDEDFINRLEDELTKIQAFKRELPLSFLLLAQAIGKLKEEAQKLGERRKEGKLVQTVGVKLGIDQFEMKTWMSSVRLWSPRGGDGDGENNQSREWQPCKYRGDGTEFPSLIESSGLSTRDEEEDEDEATLPGLSLVTPGLKFQASVEPGLKRTGTANLVCYSAFGRSTSLENKLPYQTKKKQRRCWSPDLHRRFMDSLEKLGGSQVATPKQIRELMKVEGLTNDEVKSHLQKYRLHVRKLPAPSRPLPSPSNDIAMGQDGLELGCSKTDLLQSSSPKGPLHLGISGKCNSSSVDDQDDNDNNNNNNNDNDNNDDDDDSHSSWNVKVELNR